MISRLSLALLITLAGFHLAFPRSAEAQTFFRPFRIQDQIRDQERRQRYRPNIHVKRTQGNSSTFRSGTSIPFQYRTRLGYVSKIEVRSGLKVIKTIYPKPSPSGVGRITVTSADFARAGKHGSKMKFRLWAWQGRNGFRSVHGESPRYFLVH